MASKKENLKGLFNNARTRVIIIFTAIVLALTVIIGIARITTVGGTPDVSGSAGLSRAPGNIRAVPGALDPSAQYAALVEARNEEEAVQAQRMGTSAIPTIIRTYEFGEGVEPIGPAAGEGQVGFLALGREDQLGMQRSLWNQKLKDANCSQVSVQEVIGEGAVLSDLKEVCGCTQLKDNGYGMRELQPMCSCQELKQAGFNARQMKESGFTAQQLRLCGFDACELRGAGFTVQELASGGFSAGELKGAGFSSEEIASVRNMVSGAVALEDEDSVLVLPAGINVEQIKSAGCEPGQLRALREAGVSASEIRRVNGCSVSQLKAAGFDATMLKNAGFSAAELKQAGFSPAEMKAAGFGARELLNAGFSAEQLVASGYTQAEIKLAETQLPPGVTLESIKQTGCDVEALKRHRAAGVSAALIKEQIGCDASALKQAGFTDYDLVNAGFTAQEIQSAQVATQALPLAVQRSIRAAGCDPQKLKELFEEGVSAKHIKELSGCSADALKQAGYTPAMLAAAGFSPQQLLGAGFTAQQLREAGVSASGVIADGRITDCSPASLKAAVEMGIPVATIKETLGCSLNALKEAGYTAAQLKQAGFTSAELRNAGFSALQLKAAGFSAKELREAGFGAQELKSLGFSVAELKAAGFSAQALKLAGFSVAELKASGFSAQELQEAGFSANELKEAGFVASELKRAGFSEDELAIPGLLSTERAGEAGTAAQDMVSALAEVGTVPHLEAILKQQEDQMARQLATQESQQAIQQRASAKQTVASQMLQGWRTVAAQVLVAGTDEANKQLAAAQTGGVSQPGASQPQGAAVAPQAARAEGKAVIKTGDILFAVLDTAVNSDEPGPILATLVTGPFKGAKLIGSFTLPADADKMVITFNTMSVAGASRSTSINAFAIDPNTARTALSSSTNHHYLYRYGALFASSFLEGFGNAFQSANTTISVGGTGGVTNTTVQSGIGRSIMENAVIGLATLGKSWGQVAQQQFNRPTTVEVCSGTPLGILFTQDVTSL